MGNRLFQEAKRSVDMATKAGPANRSEAVQKAKNALSSAYANSTRAEQEQLAGMQQRLDEIPSNLQL
ncbi:DUF3813 domain-containing protein [Bacillus sp. DTU_2020_1000418_1_SI_GHA_SEK_038]|uniref:DUF3813 domain-containing protein n=1 Tax=Bacillus sp. DTU_2020_1000418_1_SI_GHA_SEK_038 TaxID=3077585 RepID=UPI0028EF1D9A|nr:DUF3813 domain-containing protein [Bacillus sp. DTU_2020_1000418_1_SI_GHA_SEK_038]WNS76832.1 DUF3813 domain-containing protein [Bacillus sp. DTU_2020_1000418_1_SI_GHA_SEK_038]